MLLHSFKWCSCRYDDGGLPSDYFDDYDVDVSAVPSPLGGSPAIIMGYSLEGFIVATVMSVVASLIVVGLIFKALRRIILALGFGYEKEEGEDEEEQHQLEINEEVEEEEDEKKKDEAPAAAFGSILDTVEEEDDKAMEKEALMTDDLISPVSKTSE